MLDGVVKNITDYGAFVDLGGVDGLLHVTDIAWRRINHPSEALTIGQPVKVQVIRFNPETQRIRLGMKQLSPIPWDGVAREVPGGRQVHRPRHQHHRLRRLRGAGAGRRGPGARLRDVLDQEERPSGQDRRHLPGGGRDDPRRGRAEAPHLARPQAGQRQPLGAFAQSHPVGSSVEGEIRNITEFGLFIGLPGHRRHGPHVRPVLGPRPARPRSRTTTRARSSRPRCSTSTSRRSASRSASSSWPSDPAAGVLDSVQKGDIVTCTGHRGAGRRHRGEGRRRRRPASSARPTWPATAATSAPTASPSARRSMPRSPPSTAPPPPRPDHQGRRWRRRRRR